MNRKTISLVALVVILGCALPSQFASGASISIASVTEATSSSEFDLTALGTTDWALPAPQREGRRYGHRHLRWR